MPFIIKFDSTATKDLKAMRAFERASVLDCIARYLSDAPTRVGQSRIKRLRGLDSPQYRLRVDEMRVFYDVDVDTVHILRILAKAEVDAYLKDKGYET